eukprot:CAMPEP_0201652566 /NCGR_PEP_ID=MMETSP0493-20130528/44541_1 /ASSEMBLY_ACC=CAM_ASM_000838 /TAXON_ID=420259 /ORGANISM="Thalassiosira gravida, Strain GMp14c1" /LENGTH=1076 /DNA_ID=CAMNT_0048129083 /DNA_START=1140 /DNA_END=4371 /DNA_ORIENTATION=-
MPNFMSQFGISSDPEIQADWESRGPIQDDAVVASNSRGTVTFATSGANSRTTQIFINTADNSFLDRQGFSPIGEVVPAGDGYGGMEVVDKFYYGYGESPNQGKITAEGISYLDAEFPNLSYFEKAEFIVESSDFQEEEVGVIMATGTSFDECVTLQAFGDPSASSTYPPCCVDFPDVPFCAFLNCLDETTGFLRQGQFILPDDTQPRATVFTCECAVISELLTEIEDGTSVYASQAIAEQGLQAAAAADCCQEGTSLLDFQVCVGKSLLSSSSDPPLSLPLPVFTWSPTSSPAPEICIDENAALNDCYTTEEDLFGFGVIGCASCYITVLLEDLFSFTTCDGMKSKGFCGKYARCANEQCNLGCMDEAYDALHCNVYNTDNCDLQCSPEDASDFNSTEFAPNGAAVQTAGSFDECVLLQAFQSFGADIGADDPTAACCVDFPDSSYCAMMECIDEESGAITCECSVMVDLLADQTTGPLAQLAMDQDPSPLTTADNCCQEETSSAEFQLCMDAIFPDETGSVGFSTFSPASSFMPTPAPPCPDETAALSSCHATEEDPFGFGAIGCASCEFTALFEDFNSFYSCDGKRSNGFCGKYARCANEQCNPGCMDEAYDALHCSLYSTDGCDLQCSPEDASDFNSTEFAPNGAAVQTAGSFDECFLLQAFQSFGADIGADDPTAACCVDFPDSSYCAMMECIDEESGAITCECSVMVDLLADQTTGPLAQLAMDQDPSPLTTADNCCQEETSSAEFQLCMDAIFPDETGSVGFSTFSPASSFMPTPSPTCPDETAALYNCHATEEDPFGFGAIGCASCEFTALQADFNSFYSCDGKKNHDFCGKYARCANEECNAGCMNEVYDFLHCSLDSANDCDLQCSPEDAASGGHTTVSTTAPLTEIALPTNTGPTQITLTEGNDPVTTTSSTTLSSNVTDAAPVATALSTITSAATSSPTLSSNVTEPAPVTTTSAAASSATNVTEIAAVTTTKSPTKAPTASALALEPEFSAAFMAKDTMATFISASLLVECIFFDFVIRALRLRFNSSKMSCGEMPSCCVDHDGLVSDHQIKRRKLGVIIICLE